MRQSPVCNYGYFARGFFNYKGQLEYIETSVQFPSTLGLLEIADRAKAWATSTPGVEAYQLFRRMPGERAGKPVGCKIMLENSEVCHG